MNSYLLIAGVLAILLGLIHSVLGEVLVFRHLRDFESFAQNSKTKLKARHLRTLWSTWHLASIFGWGFGAILIWFARNGITEKSALGVLTAISITLSVGAIFWVYGTKAKHPGWIVMLAIAVLSWLATRSL